MPCNVTDAVCLLVQNMEPALPLGSVFLPNQLNPCVRATSCLPYVHVISGWHTFSDEALAWLRQIKAIEQRSGSCFDDWGESDEGGQKWFHSWGKGPAAGDSVLLTHCNKLLTWYPAFAGRYTSAWGKAYGPCKTREVAKGGDYYSKAMWQVCRPEALAAHDAAMGTGGPGHEATPPFVMKAVYGARVRIISAIRNPVDRLETSFWGHRHYPVHYGATSEGLGAYIKEQGGAFTTCSATHGARRCAYLFELLGKREGDVFFHADQVIRGLYEPFIADWQAAFGTESFLTIMVEALLDTPRLARGRVLHFLGLPGAPFEKLDILVPLPGTPTAPGTYKALHCASLRGAKAAPMRNDTRAQIEAFYRPYNIALGDLLRWSRADRAMWSKSTECSAEDIASAHVKA